MSGCDDDHRVVRLLPFDRWDSVCAALVAGLAVLVLSRGLTEGGFRFGDAAVHAMDGVLIHDWLAAGPTAWLSPVEFALQQYAHYPSLGIGRHYPPGFAMVESGFFGLFGISVVTARLCVVFFGVLAVLGTYVFVRRIGGRRSATLAAAALASAPAFTEWGRQVMLEVPTLAAVSWAAVAWQGYRRRPTWWRWGGMIAAALAVLLFRQSAWMLLGAIAVTLSFVAWRTKARWLHAALAMGLALAVLVALLFSFERAGAELLRGRATFPSLWEVRALTYYATVLPSQVGWAVVVTATIGLAATWFRREPAAVFLTACLVVTYGIMTAADYKCPRFFFLALLPLVSWAGLGAGWLVDQAAVRTRRVVVAVLLGAMGWQGYAAPLEIFPDYGQVVAAHRNELLRRVLLVDADRDTHLVFAARQYLPWRQVVVVRGSKLFYTCTAHTTFDFQPLVGSAEELAGVMQRYAFSYVISEREDKGRIEQHAWLRRFLDASSRYQRVATFALTAQDPPSYRDATLDVYELALPQADRARTLEVPIPRINRTVILDLRGWEESHRS